MFHYKDRKDIWKGEGIYHVTFNVAGKECLLGELKAVPREMLLRYYKDEAKWRAIPAVNDKDEVAMVELSPLGFAISEDLKLFGKRHEGMEVIKKMIMDNHIHFIVWVRRDVKQSVLQALHGFQIGVTQIAKKMGEWPRPAVGEREGVRQDERDTFLSIYKNKPVASEADDGLEDGSLFVANERACNARADADDPLKTGDGHILQKPFLRTLYGNGQLQDMYDYISLNAYRKWVVIHNPELFTMHKDTMVEGLRFRSMGNHWLLDWPVRQMVECSRSAVQEDWDRQLENVLFDAKLGAVTYTAAVNKGEAYIARKLREAGYPLVVLMKEGFPPVGSDGEKYFKPGGVYFDTCKEARLLLMEAYPETYEDKRVVAATDNVLRRKAEERHRYYEALPHNTMRWRFIAGNEIIRILVSRTDT